MILNRKFKVFAWRISALVLIIFSYSQPQRASASCSGLSLGLATGASKCTKGTYAKSVGWTPFVGGLTELRFPWFLIELSMGYARKTYMPDYVVGISNYSNGDKLHYTNYFSHLSSKFYPSPLPTPFHIYAGGGIGVSFVWNEALQFREPPKLFYSKVLDIYPLIGIAYMFQKQPLKIFIETRYVYHSEENFSNYTSGKESLFIFSGVAYEFRHTTHRKESFEN